MAAKKTKPARIATLEHGTYIVAPFGPKPYRVITWDPHAKKQIERTASNEAEARQLARQLDAYKAAKVSLADSGRTMRALSEATIRGLTEAKKAPRYISKIRECHAKWVLPTLGDDMLVTDWTPADTERVIAAVAAECGGHRVADVGGSMRSMVTRAMKMRWLIPGDANADPMWGVSYSVKAQQQHQTANFVDRDQLPTLNQCASVEDSMAEVLDPRWATAMRLCRETMIRWGELLALRPENFIFTNPDGEVHRELQLRTAIEEDNRVFNEKGLKNEQRRETSWASWLTPELERLVAAAEPGEFLFTRPSDGGHPDRSWWSRKLAKAFELAEVERGSWTIHDWRHVGACTWLFDRRCDPGAVTYAIGHANVAFTLSAYTAHRGPAIGSLMAASER